MVKIARLAARDERGASDVFMLMLLTLLVGFAGLTFDAGMLFNARREATNAAHAAARAAADATSTDDLYADGVARIGVEFVPEIHAALPAGIELTGWDVSDDRDEIRVSVKTEHEPHILHILGFSTFTIRAEAKSRVSNQAG